MLAITHFEVYVLKNGRWTLHARYASADRQDAIIDARHTEFATRYPTKVVSETYFPEENHTDAVTIYWSPKAKELSERKLKARLPFRAGRAAKADGDAPKITKARRPRHGGSTFFRVMVAGVMSLISATAATAIFAWLLKRFAAMGVTIPEGAMTTVVTYIYVLSFLFFFLSLVRSRLPLARVLTEWWQRSKMGTQGAANTNTAAAKPPRVKPKYDREPSPHVQRELDDMKTKRGDLDVAPPPQLPEPVIATQVVAEVNPPVPAVPVAADKPKEKEKTEAARQEEKKQKAAEKAAREKQKAAEAEAQQQQETFALESLMLRRFATEVINPALNGTVPDDPVTRRGAALAMAGAAKGLSATSGLMPASIPQLLATALPIIGMNEAAIAMFMSQYGQHIDAAANQPLVDTGRHAVAFYLEGKVDVRPMITSTLAAWRTPFGQPFGAPPVAPAVEIPPAIHDAYLLTETRDDDAAGADAEMREQRHDATMGVHNSIVRTLLADHAGHEVKHTGKGIFARFATAVAAMAAARDMQTRFSESNVKVAMSVIGNSDASEDPALSATLFYRAEEAVTGAVAGEIHTDAQVQAAITANETDAPFGAAAGAMGNTDRDPGPDSNILVA